MMRLLTCDIRWLSLCGRVRHAGFGRAEAFRLSMRELIEKGSLAEAHPSQWAPFVVVGEGG